MKKYLLISFLFVLTCLSSSGQTWLWGRQGIGSYKVGDEGYSVAIDSSHNLYMTGFFQNTLVFGLDTLVNSSSLPAVYIVKYDSLGNVLWARQSQNGYVNGNVSYVAVDANGSVYLVGSFFSVPITFGANTLSTHNQDAFIVKYDVNGNVMWAKQSIGANTNSLGGITSASVDKNGNLFITGFFRDTLHFGLNALISPKNNSHTDVFVTKYDFNGNVLWAKQASGETNTYAQGASVAVDKLGDVYLIGDYSDTLTFGSHTLSTPFNKYYVFIVKYDSYGNVIWAKNSITKSSGYMPGATYAVAVDNSCNSYVTGAFADTIIFGSQKLISKISGNFNVFIAKYDSSGKVLWAQEANQLDNNNWYGFSLVIDTNENIYLGGGGGTGSCALKFGGNSVSTTTGANDHASFIYKFNSEGQVLCGDMIPIGGDDEFGIVVEPSGKDVFLASDIFSTTAVFGPDTIGTLTAKTEWPFIACVDLCTTVPLAVNNITRINQDALLYPNPNKGVFIISMGSTNAQSTVDVYNILGEKIYSQLLRQTQGCNSIINLGSQPNGIYLYRINSEEGKLISSGKFVIQK